MLNKNFLAIKAYLKEEMNVENEIRLDSHIRNDLGVDSLDMTDLIFFVEGMIEQEIQFSEIENLSTINDLIKYIEVKSESYE